MTLRFLEIIVPSSRKTEAESILKQHAKISPYKCHHFESSLSLQVILAAEDAEMFMDAMQEAFGGDESFRIVLFPLEAVVPRIAEPVEKSKTPPKPHVLMRVSREELFNDISGHTELSALYVLMVILSAIVVSIGILYENGAAIIGAMVIAPLLGPNVALSFATTLGDLTMAKKAARVNLTGLAIAFGLSFALGCLLPIEADNAEILVRTQVRPGDAVLALAAGCAATLAFTSGAPGALIGVMVAVALMPPLVTAGLMLAASNFKEAFGALLLLLTNVISINLSGVLTFWAQGIRPFSWWEAGRARKATLVACLLWGGMLAALIMTIWLSRRS